METLSHSWDPARAVSEIYRILRPGGHIVFPEFDHIDATRPQLDTPQDMLEAIIRIKTATSSPDFNSFVRGELQHTMEDRAFVDITSSDLTENIRPLARLFWLLVYFPYFLIRLLRLQSYLGNTEDGFQGYRTLSLGYWRCIVLTARKPAARDDQADV
ncbi:MAG: hypothetical protein Q9216_005177 [Gyalolechia sp. 2 TL-2023]